MQQPLYQNRHNLYSFPSRLATFSVPIGMVALSLGLGCFDPSAGTGDTKNGTFEGVSLKVRSGDRAIVAALNPAAQSWASRTGGAG